MGALSVGIFSNLFLFTFHVGLSNNQLKKSVVDLSQDKKMLNINELNFLAHEILFSIS